MFDQYFEKFDLAPEITAALKKCKCIAYAETKEELQEMAYGPTHTSRYDVVYPIEGNGTVKEAEVVRCKNGPVVNFMEDYMRRRDPDCMRIGDDLPTDKPRFEDVYGYKFSKLRQETMDWLATQQIILLPFKAGGKYYGYDSLMICPMNAAFFALSLANMQGFESIFDVKHGFTPRGIIYVAPPFRHTHFSGKQVVVHQRSEKLHEVFSYNLYPGPSAKKGVFSMLLDIGEHEGWITNHASAALLETPYENEIVFMHEGASGGGKSEMLQDIAREPDGEVLLSTNTVTGEKTYLHISSTCKIEPVCDDMATCYPGVQNNSGKLVLVDGEDGWFLRMDGVTHYGCDPVYERICTEPKEPLCFFNMEGHPGATLLIWEHTLDSNGKPCSNPRAIVPRWDVPNIVKEPVEVDVRSFGVRMPPSTRDNPNYGIMGMLHIIPPALAWLWRLIAPRGFNNPSIVTGNELKSEGVGSYWPFATGKRVKQANLLLHQIVDSPNTRYVLIPNQHIGVYKVGFAAEWISREYLARHGGAKIRREHLEPARCPLLGYAMKDLTIDGQKIRSKFLRVDTQDRVGTDGYDAGAKILTDFFRKELAKFDTPELEPLGKQIIDCFMNGGTLEDFEKITPTGL